MPTSKEIMDRAMRQQRPDQIPVMCQLANGHTIIDTGVHHIDFVTRLLAWLVENRVVDTLEVAS